MRDISVAPVKKNDLEKIEAMMDNEYGVVHRSYEYPTQSKAFSRMRAASKPEIDWSKESYRMRSSSSVDKSVRDDQSSSGTLVDRPRPNEIHGFGKRSESWDSKLLEIPASPTQITIVADRDGRNTDPPPRIQIDAPPARFDLEDDENDENSNLI